VIRQYAKGILSGLLAGLSGLSVALPDVTMQDWVNIAIAALVAGGVVTAVPNKAAPQPTPVVTPHP
jgi:hypothetical protein